MKPETNISAEIAPENNQNVQENEGNRPLPEKSFESLEILEENSYEINFPELNEPHPQSKRRDGNDSNL
jgi:predicted  nucleic acid-binding Zn-ribbon protein